MTNSTARRLQVLYVPCRKDPYRISGWGDGKNERSLSARLEFSSGSASSVEPKKAGGLVEPLLPDLQLASRALCAPVKLLQQDILRVEAVELVGITLRDDHFGIPPSHGAETLLAALPELQCGTLLPRADFRDGSPRQCSGACITGVSVPTLGHVFCNTVPGARPRASGTL